MDTPTPKRPRGDEPATPGLPTPTPTSAPRQSTRLSTLPAADYLLPSPAKASSEPCTEACESDETFEGSDEEPESDQEFDDLEERLLDNDSDTEDLPSDESAPVTERLPFAKTTVLVPFVDENGLTRIGTQPKKPAVYIGWAPRVDAADRIRNRALHLWSLVDSKFLVSVPIDNSAEIKGLQEKIMGSLGNYLNDESKVMLRCDYTGVEMSWAAGPQSWSIEAIYPYIVSSKRVAYHAPQNIGPVSTALNWAKGKGAAILLPSVATWLNTTDDSTIGFEERKGRWSWAFNAVTNECLIAGVYGLRLNHQHQLDKWAKWSPEKQRETLELMRTGTKTVNTTRELAAHTGKLFYIKSPKELSKSGRVQHNDA